MAQQVAELSQQISDLNESELDTMMKKVNDIKVRGTQSQQHLQRLTLINLKRLSPGAYLTKKSASKTPTWQRRELLGLS